jgi:hypothetical protein
MILLYHPAEADETNKAADKIKARARIIVQEKITGSGADCRVRNQRKGEGKTRTS